jgi:methylase of polypeptide subunit release factors
MTCFSSADESAHYGFSVCLLLEHYREQLRWVEEGIVELGTGDATAIADVVASLPELRVASFDISGPSVREARANIAARGVADRYTVEHGDFFDAADSSGGLPVSTVISNPPYVPAPDQHILMPELWGGLHGNDLVLQLLKAGYENVITAVASYSDPVTTVRTAGDLGYRVANFLTMALDFGRYSSEPNVRAHIQRLCDEGKAWAEDDGYMVAVALFTRNPDIRGERADQLLRSLQFCP